MQPSAAAIAHALWAALATTPQAADAAAFGDECPRPADVWANVAALVGHEKALASDQRPPLAIDDVGDHFRVMIAGRAHDYADGARDCARRAQTAAVFVGLTLWPLELSPAPQTAIEASGVATPQPPMRVWSVGVEVGPTIGLAVADGAAGAGRTMGVALHAVLMRRNIGVVAGVGAGLATPLSIRGITVDERRLPFELGVRWKAFAGSRLTLALDASVVAALLDAAPEGAPASGQRTWDIGGRFGVIVSYRLIGGAQPHAASSASISVFMQPFAEASARPRTLALEPGGGFGETSWLREGGLFGVAVGFP